MNAQASINADRNHSIYISLCWHVSLKQYDIVLPQPRQLSELDKDSKRRQAVLHHKVFDGKHKSTALSNHFLNVLEKWQIVKVKCHVLHMKTKQTWRKLLVIGIGLVQTIFPASCNYTLMMLSSNHCLCIKVEDYFCRLKFDKFFQNLLFFSLNPAG